MIVEKQLEQLHASIQTLCRRNQIHAHSRDLAPLHVVVRMRAMTTWHSNPHINPATVCLFATSLFYETMTSHLASAYSKTTHDTIENTARIENTFISLCHESIPNGAGRDINTIGHACSEMFGSLTMSAEIANLPRHRTLPPSAYDSLRFVGLPFGLPRLAAVH